MANESEIANWVLENSNSLDLKIDLFNWPTHFGLDIFDLQARVIFNNKRFFGRGSDKKLEIALNKAIAEIVERIHLKFSSAENSNGFAAHYDLSQAMTNSYFELIERDLFFCHYLTNTAFSRLENIDFPFYNKSKMFLESNGVQLQAFCLGKSDTLTSTMVVAFGSNRKKSFGFCFGTSTKDDLEYSINSATIECLRQVSYIINQGEATEPILKNTPELNDRTNSFYRHFELSINVDYFNSIKHLFFSSGTAHIGDNYFEIKDVTFEHLKSDLIPFRDSPFHVVYASSDKCQNLYIGETSPEKINFERLCQFTQNPNFCWEMVNKIIHPFD